MYTSWAGLYLFSKTENNKLGVNKLGEPLVRNGTVVHHRTREAPHKSPVSVVYPNLLDLVSHLHLFPAIN